MAKYITAADAAAIAPGQKACLTVENVPLVLFNHEGTIGALLNVCPHAGLPLGEGEVNGRTITCPFHGYTFDMATGRNVDFEGDAPATVLPVRIQDGKVEVDIESLL